jgi:hypothetical protein
MHRHLAEHRGDRALDALGQQREARLRRLRRLQEAPEDDRLAEHRRGLGQRQWRVLVQQALARRERGVHAVAQLVREREHVAAACRPVEQSGRDGRPGR